ncbi:hypothetical protein Ga0080574_TMP2157 [Salipiger abyssi]|uniref:Uncharacterized protein n=1 Tax=Salipiger abyssi TaxID=1250539 RepID=A0A1P8USV9_9RHOB|nr:hypothetical protein Ga0080574_TMP2157 [Salipiger abyssi]
MFAQCLVDARVSARIHVSVERRKVAQIGNVQPGLCHHEHPVNVFCPAPVPDKAMGRHHGPDGACMVNPLNCAISASPAGFPHPARDKPCHACYGRA